MLSNENASKIGNRLGTVFTTLSVRVDAEKREVIAIAKTLRLDTTDLKTLADITKGATVLFGRSGANFRMIIS